MKKISGFLAALLLSLPGFAQTTAFGYPTFTQTLTNGLKVVVCEKKDNPLVECEVWYRTGSKDEWDGVRGMAHMFEHMMFRGSRNYPGDGDVFIDSLESFGGQVNAYTTFDRTVYHETIPADKLMNVLKMEADRMGNLTLSQQTLDVERQVVGQELRNGQSNWFQRMQNQVYDHLYPEGHPYRVDVIGYLPQIVNFTTTQCQSFYDKFYAPNNAVLVLVGNVDHADAFAKAQEAFGPITKQLPPPPPVLAPDLYSDTLHQQEYSVDFPVQIYGYIIPKPAATDSDFFAFLLLKDLLFDNENSLLRTKLIDSLQLVYALQNGSDDWSLYPNLCQEYFIMPAAPGNVKVKKIIAAEINNILDDGIDETRIADYLDNLKARELKAAYNVENIASQLGMAEMYFHDFNQYARMREKMETLHSADLQRVAKKYFDPARLRVVNIKPSY